MTFTKKSRRYHDIVATSLGVCSSILTPLLDSNNPALNPMQIFHLSRLGWHRNWGEPLSGEDMVVDAVIYRPVELVWKVLLARFKISNLMSRCESQTSINEDISSILDQLLDLRSVRVFSPC